MRIINSKRVVFLAIFFLSGYCLSFDPIISSMDHHQASVSKSHSSKQDQKNPLTFVPDLDNTVFRHEIIKFVRAAAIRHLTSNTLQPMKNLDEKWNNHYQKTDWQVSITVYRAGENLGHATAHGKSLADALKQATGSSLEHVQPIKRESDLDHYRFQVDLDYFPAQRYSLIEYETNGLELLGNRVAVRKLTRDDIETQVHRSQDYLLRMMEPHYHGFFKFYDAAEDHAETLLRTIYSASSLYTLIQLNHWFQSSPSEKSVLIHHDQLKPVADFILSNQVVDGPNAGGFYYGFDSVSHQRVCRVVVGTTAKTIFTLLALHQDDPHDTAYLKHAIKAGNWLLKMVDEKGQVTPIADCTHQHWQYSHRQSMLYSGQVLSALSRLYVVTKDVRYQRGAQFIANYFVSLVEKNGPLVGDEYRPANAISSSWILMSLMDFTQVDNNPIYQKTLKAVAQAILKRQISRSDDAYNQGRYLDAMTASGNGWINEVMGTYYSFCLHHEPISKPSLSEINVKSHAALQTRPHIASENCQPYLTAMINTSRWLLQNAYTTENSYQVKNPARALGGFITNFRSSTVRTDAVCHGVNSLLALLQATDPTNGQGSARGKNPILTPKLMPIVLLSIPERPLMEILPLMRSGGGACSRDVGVGAEL